LIIIIFIKKKIINSNTNYH